MKKENKYKSYRFNMISNERLNKSKYPVGALRAFLERSQSTCFSFIFFFFLVWLGFIRLRTTYYCVCVSNNNHDGNPNFFIYIVNILLLKFADQTSFLVR